MGSGSNELDWTRLISLLSPVHDQARATARRLSRSTSDGDDLFQEAVLRAYEKLPSLRDPSAFRTWFYRILLTVHASRSRRAFWRRFLSIEGGAREEILGRTGEDGRIREGLSRQASRASRALATLPAAQREAVVLFDIDGHSVEEVAALQGCSTSAVKSRLARGRERLRRHYVRSGWAPADASGAARGSSSVLREGVMP